MKASEIIEFLSKVDSESEVRIQVYNCNGFDDSYAIDFVDTIEFDGIEHPFIAMSVGCDHKSHKTAVP